MFDVEFDHADAKWYVTHNTKRLDRVGSFTAKRYALEAIEKLAQEAKLIGEKRQDESKGKPPVPEKAVTTNRKTK
tara:strand:- start:8322 stop:8546 length:225 start_codon:yes stop_codon:yes gene_type:complete